MKVLLIDPMRNKTTKPSKITDFQLFGYIRALNKIGVEAHLGVYNETFNIKDITEVHLDDLTDLTDYDSIFIINFVTNFFGGVVEVKVFRTFELLAKTDKPIHFICSDPAMPMKQVYQLTHRLAAQLDVPTIPQDDYKLESKVNILYHNFNRLEAEKIIKSKTKDIDYKLTDFPVQIASTWEEHNPKVYEEYNLEDRKVDIIYGGSFRSGRREQQMIDFLFNHNKLEVILTGNIREKQFKLPYDKAPEFKGKLPFTNLQEYNKQSIATIIIGDKIYEKNFIPLRLIEALQAGQIPFIDTRMDPNNEMIKTEGLGEFLLVNNKEEMEHKIHLFKTVKELREAVLRKLNEELKEYRPEVLFKSLEELLKGDK